MQTHVFFTVTQDKELLLLELSWLFRFSSGWLENVQYYPQSLLFLFEEG